MASHGRVNDFKVVLLGEGRVGKTSLLVRFVDDKFNDREQATVQARPFAPRPLQLGTQKVQLSLWDTAGQERFHSLGPIYYRDASAALLVFDITDIDSFERVKAWVKELRQMVNPLLAPPELRKPLWRQVGPDIVLAIAANKSDLERERSVPDAVVQKYAAEIGASCFATSAKTGQGLERAFADIARRCLERQHARLAREASLGTSSIGSQVTRRRQGGLVIADESTAPPPPPPSGCC